MKKLILLFSITASLLVLSTRMQAQSPAPTQNAEAKDVAYQQQVVVQQPVCPVCPAGPAAPAPSSYDPSLSIQVDPNLQLIQCDQVTYQQMATILSGSQFVPNDRTNYFSAYTNSNTESITGWAAYVETVQPNCQGYLVTISVMPGISSTTYGPAAVMFGSNYLEQYQVTNGQATYVGAQDPDGTAGNQFMFIGL